MSSLKISHNSVRSLYQPKINHICTDRYDCRRDLPIGLACLLHCVQWNNRDEVSEMQNLLNEWPLLSEEYALELLDYAYADSSVRRFAVKCIKNLG